MFNVIKHLQAVLYYKDKQNLCLKVFLYKLSINYLFIIKFARIFKPIKITISITINQ